MPLVTLLRLEAIREERVAAGGIDQIPGIPAFGAAILVHGLDAGASTPVQELDLADAAAFNDERARLGGTADEYLVERRAPDLIGESQGFVPGVREFEFLVPSVPGRDELRTPFLHADGPDPVRHPQALEQG